MKVYLITTAYGCCVGIETVRLVQIPAIRKGLFEKQYSSRILAKGTYALAMAAELGVKMQPPGS
jgi:hypothetical protein